MPLLIGTVSGAIDLAGDHLLDGERVKHLVSDEDTWWAVAEGGSIFRGGTAIASMPDSATAQCVQPTHQTIWVGADRARLYAVEDEGPVEDPVFADAPGREEWHTPWGGPADIRSMAVDADHTLYVNVHVGGILRYDNTGVVPTIDIHSDVHQVAAHPSLPGAVFAACAYGLAVSRNGHDFEIRSDGLHATYCRAVVVLDDRLLVSASTGPRSSSGRLYRGDLWSGGFEPLTRGLPEWFESNLDTHCLAVSGGSIYAGNGDTVWRSDDGGDTWDLAVSGLPQITCLG